MYQEKNTNEHAKVTVTNYVNISSAVGEVPLGLKAYLMSIHLFYIYMIAAYKDSCLSYLLCRTRKHTSAS